MKTEEWNEIPAFKPDPVYFAKYLLVEGEIKEGDKAIDENIKSKSNVVTITFNKHGIASDGRGTYSDAGLKKLKKVKLFLCSRDNPDVPIGQISERAKFVKEETEFSEEDFKVWGVVEDRPMKERDIPYMISKGIDYIIKIKCPCCDSFM